MASPSFLTGGHTPNRNDTMWFIEQRILGAIIDNAVGGGGAGVGQVYYYTGNAPAFNPADTAGAAIAYSRDNSNVTYTWNVDTQAWM